MVWIYLAESEESHSPLNHGCEPLPIVNKTDMRKPFCFREWQKGKLIPLQSGMMCEPSLEICCPQSISSLEGFHARILALQEMELAWKESEADCFLKLSAWLASYDQDSFSWKTCQLSLFEGLTEFSWSSLRWGTTVGGRLYQPPRWVPRTSESDGSYLPTPATVDGGSYFNKSKSLGAALRPTLGAMAKYNLWPTPTVCGNYQKKRNMIGLATEVGGALNPTWVEWLMGFQGGWTELNALGMRWFQSRRVKRLKD